MNKAEPAKKRWIFRPLSFFVIWGLLALLLVLNGLYEAKRAKDNLYRLLADEGAAVLEGVAQSAQSLLKSLAALETQPEAAALLSFSSINLLNLEDSVIDWLLEAAVQIDRRLGPGEVTARQLEKSAREQKIAGIEVFAGAGKRVAYGRPGSAAAREEEHLFYLPLLQGKASYAIRRSENRATGQMDSLSVAVLRKAGEGVLILRADEADIGHLRRRVVLQGVVEEWAGKGDVAYIRFQGKDGEVWAGFDSRKGDRQEPETPWIEREEGGRERAGTLRHRMGKGLFELGQSLFPETPESVFLLIGLDTAKVDRIIRGDVRNVALFSLLLLAFAGIGIVFVYRLEVRHLGRVREMEEKIQRSEKLSSLANLAAGVAHEIRNPLNAIGMAIQRLQREFPQENPELQKEYFQFTDVLRGEVKRVNEIIEQFLFFARPARLDLAPLRLEDVFSELAVLLKEPTEREKIILEEEIDPGLPELRGDRQRLKEALWNLIQNSMQAMTAGGRLQIRAKSPTPREIRVEIEDTGEGIPEENLGRIFDYYFTTKEKGMGLGLPLAHKIIQAHGGVISVRSRPGEGTVFEIVLPVLKEEK